MKYRTSDNQHTILIISAVKIKMMEVELYNNLIFPEGSMNVLREIKERCCTDGSMKCGLNIRSQIDVFTFTQSDRTDKSGN